MTDAEKFLAHYGKLGMKWGRKKGPSPDKIVKKERKIASKNRRHLTDADLQKRIERFNSEKKLKELTDNDVAPGKTAVVNTLKFVGDKTIKAVASGAALYAVKVALTKEFSLKEAAGYLAPRPKTK